MTTPASPPTFQLRGNHPALDLLNTRPTVDGAPSEQLTSFGALVDLLSATGLVTQEDAAYARKSWARSDATLIRARGIRELLRKAVTQIADGGAVSPADLVRLNAELRDASVGEYTEVRPSGGGYGFRHRLRRDGPGDVLAPLVRAMAALLTESDLAHVRQCEDAGCSIYFLDTSKNHRRRWCSMALCGNRNKVEAYRDRTAPKSGASTAGPPVAAPSKLPRRR
jgi:predicted RNA-binding Zn ribbon-like protein